MPIVYRIVRDKYRKDPFSTTGSRLYGGRWNPKGTGILYTASTPELGLLEMLAHMPGIRYEDLPPFWILSLKVPDEIRRFPREQMPDFWQDHTYEQTQNWLKDWLVQPDTLGVAVPSVILPVSCNILLHPLHHLFEKITLCGEEKLQPDKRLWHSEPG